MQNNVGSGRRRSGWVASAGLVVLTAAIGLTACTSDPDGNVDTDELSDQLATDGAAIVDEFETDPPREGELSSNDLVADASEDVQCDDGVLRVWHTDLSLSWPGQANDLELVDTYFDGMTDWLAGRFRERDFTTVSQTMGDVDEPRSSVFERTVGDDEVSIEYTVDFELADEQPDNETITVAFSVVGSTPCLEQ